MILEAVLLWIALILLTMGAAISMDMFFSNTNVHVLPKPLTSHRMGTLNPIRWHEALFLAFVP